MKEVTSPFKLDATAKTHGLDGTNMLIIMIQASDPISSNHMVITCRHRAAVSLVELIDSALWYNSLAVAIFPSFHSIHPQA